MKQQRQKQRHYPSTSEMDYDEEETAFLKAADEYRHANGIRFLTSVEQFRILKLMGYRKVVECSP